MNLGDQVRDDFDLRILFFARKNLRTTRGQLRDEFIKINANVMRPIGFQVFCRTVIQFLRPANVAVAKMVQTNGNLNQPLIKLPRRPLILLPQFFPDLVRLEEFALVEILRALDVPRVEFRFPCPWPLVYDFWPDSQRPHLGHLTPSQRIRQNSSLDRVIPSPVSRQWLHPPRQNDTRPKLCAG